MGEWTAVHRHAGNIPLKFKDIPEGTAWVREDHFHNGHPDNHTRGHEEQERKYMAEGPLFGKPLSYREAHWRTNLLWPGEWDYYLKK